MEILSAGVPKGQNFLRRQGIPAHRGKDFSGAWGKAETGHAPLEGYPRFAPGGGPKG